MLSEFANCRIMVCPRSCNKVADAIAAFGCNLSGGVPTTWDLVPPFVEEMVTNNCAESYE